MSEHESGEFEPQQGYPGSQQYQGYSPEFEMDVDPDEPLEVPQSPQSSEDSEDYFVISVSRTVEQLIGERQEIARIFKQIPWSELDLQRALQQRALQQQALQQQALEDFSSPPSPQFGYPVEKEPVEKEPVQKEPVVDVDDEFLDDEIEEQDERDPDEFETMNEAEDYATELAWEILEELLTELATAEDEDLSTSDFDDEDKQRIVEEVVYPAVWEAMG